MISFNFIYLFFKKKINFTPPKIYQYANIGPKINDFNLTWF